MMRKILYVVLTIIALSVLAYSQVTRIRVDDIMVKETPWLDVRAYGATGDGTTDDSSAIQDAIDAALDGGGTVYFPPGYYQVKTGLVIDTSGLTGPPYANKNRINIKGSGKGNTVLRGTTPSMTILTIDSGGGGTASHGYFTISDIAIADSLANARSSTGIEFTDQAYFSINEVTLDILNIGLYLNSALSANFTGLIFNYCNIGVKVEASSNANYWEGCEWRFCLTRAFESDNSTQHFFTGCQIEANGSHGVAGEGGMQFNYSGTGGTTVIAATFVGCYFESNRGDWDVYLNETNALTLEGVFVGCNFYRIGNAAYVTNNIKTVGSTIVSLAGCSFMNFSTYSPDAGRPHINLDTDSKMIDMGGNRFDDSSTEYPNVSIPALANDATPSVLDGRYFLTGGTTTITDFDDGVTGQIITIISEHAITITDGTNIFLNGSGNFVMAATDTLTLICKADNKWYEISRSDNT
jgi:hypothetical protein